MKLHVRRVGAHGKTTRHVVELSLVRFLKHFAMAGYGFAPSVGHEMRVLGAFLWYGDYLAPRDFSAGHFGEPPSLLADPTGKAQFSNLVGKAFADYLSRRYLRTFVSFNYEGAMRVLGHPITGERPDLVGLTRSTAYALEAKGYTRCSVSRAEMVDHKHQARAGPIGVKHCVASVSYCLYDRPAAWFWDPPGDVPAASVQQVQSLLRAYFTGIASLVRGDRIVHPQLAGRDVYAISADIPIPFLSETSAGGEIRSATLRLVVDASRVAVDYPAVSSKPTNPVEGDGFFLDSDGVGVVVAPTAV